MERSYSRKKKPDIGDCRAFDYNYIQLLTLLEVLDDDTNIDLIKKYTRVLEEALEILDDICTSSDLKKIKIKADIKISGARSKIKIYIKVKKDKKKKYKEKIEISLTIIAEANIDLEASGRPPKPPPNKYVPEKVISESIEIIIEAEIEIKIIIESRRRIETMICLTQDQRLKWDLRFSMNYMVQQKTEI